MAEPAIAPLYSTESANESLLLYEGEMQLLFRGDAIGCTGVVRLNWLPSPRLEFDIELERMIAFPAEGATLRLVGISTEGHADFLSLVESSRGAGGTEVRAQGLLDGCEIGGTRTLDHVYFHLVNFRKYDGKPIEQESRLWRGRAEAAFGEWKLTLDAVPDITELERQRSLRGGFAITHVGKLEKSDGNPFVVGQVIPVLEGLRYALSLARGQLVALSLPVGFSGVDRSWEKWINWVVDPWTNARSWLPTSGPDSYSGRSSIVMSRSSASARSSEAASGPDHG